MRRIAIIGSRGYPSYYSGFETLVRHLAPYLVERGEHVTVYDRGRTRRPVSKVINGIEVRSTVGLDTKSTSTLSYGYSSIADAARGGFDAALVLNVANGLHLGRLKRAGVRTCVNVDGMEWQREKWGFVAKRTFLRGAKMTAALADELVFDSRALAGLWTAKFHRGGRFIPYGAPILEVIGDGLLVERGLPNEGYVLAVCRVVPENNLDLLFDALAYMDAATPVVVVGDSNYDHRTLQRLRALSASGRLHWLGHVNDQALLDQLWGNAGVYWHGHSVGGTNPSLLQALGAGAPTVALDTVFNREVIGSDEQLVGSHPGELASRLRDVLGSPEGQERMRARGRTSIAERYSWSSVCAAYHELLVGAVGARRAP
jgi:glycosyltransferase involved in cell wall biosynthesis